LTLQHVASFTFNALTTISAILHVIENIRTSAYGSTSLT